VFQQVPVLPVVVPLAAATSVALLRLLHRRRRLTVPRAAVALALCVYVAGVVANTVFPIYLDKPSGDAAWDAHLELVPIVGYELDDALMNVGVFVPLGILVALALARPSWPRVTAVVAGLSLTIEVVQLVTAHTLGGGHVADVNDLLFNVVGGVLGFALLRVLERVPRLTGLVARFRWQPGTD
jgi:hypothetical protein